MVVPKINSRLLQKVLDPIMTNVIGELILNSVRELGATTLSITSNMKGARQIVDRIAMIYDGKII
jgi:phospholipid/cholesterol/gamma-HCH transport system ATP-binding protein